MDTELANKFSTRMMDDNRYKNWHDNYTGKTDDGFEVPIDQVAPEVVNSLEATGYKKCDCMSEVSAPWGFLMFKRGFFS